MVVRGSQYRADGRCDQFWLIGGDVMAGPIGDDQQRTKPLGEFALLALPLPIELLDRERREFGCVGRR